jgi:hypothetical protein
VPLALCDPGRTTSRTVTGVAADGRIRAGWLGSGAGHFDVEVVRDLVETVEALGQGEGQGRFV